MMQLLGSYNSPKKQYVNNNSRAILLLASDDKSYVCKTIHGLHKANSLFCEILCYLIMKHFELNIPLANFIEVDKELLKECEYLNKIEEQKVCFWGSQFINNSSELVFDLNDHINKSEQQLIDIIGISIFDLLFFNNDRTPKNPNLLRTIDRIYAIDHGQCFNAMMPTEFTAQFVATQDDLIIKHSYLRRLMRNYQKNGNVSVLCNEVQSKLRNKILGLLTVFHEAVEYYKSHYGKDVSFEFFESFIKNVDGNYNWYVICTKIFNDEIRKMQ